MTGHCAICKRELDVDSRFTWRRMQGWARPGQAGGSDVANRHFVEPPEFAHDDCVRREKAGIDPGQGTLL